MAADVGRETEVAGRTEATGERIGLKVASEQVSSTILEGDLAGASSVCFFGASITGFLTSALEAPEAGCDFEEPLAELDSPDFCLWPTLSLAAEKRFGSARLPNEPQPLREFFGTVTTWNFCFFDGDVTLES